MACNFKLFKISYADGPQITIVWLYYGVKVIGIQQKPYFEFGILIFSWASDTQLDALVMLGSGSETQLPSQPWDTPITILYTCNPSVVPFQYSGQYITWEIQHFIIQQLCWMMLPNCRLM